METALLSLYSDASLFARALGVLTSDEPKKSHFLKLANDNSELARQYMDGLLDLRHEQEPKCSLEECLARVCTDPAVFARALAVLSRDEGKKQAFLAASSQPDRARQLLRELLDVASGNTAPGKCLTHGLRDPSQRSV